MEVELLDNVIDVHRCQKVPSLCFSLLEPSQE
jgi:hypothetical protein